MDNGDSARRRVVVTGLGVITPVGHNVADTWAAILAGRSGFGPITLVDNPQHTIQGLCEVKAFDPAQYMDRKDARRRDPTCAPARSLPVPGTCRSALFRLSES